MLYGASFIIDRYVLALFVKVLFVCFASLTGLWIVIDAFGNLDEFINYGKQQGGLLNVLVSYYGAHTLSFFDQISALLCLIACMFVVTWMQRYHETTAIMAGGVPAGRVVRPLLIAAVLVSLLAAANRELIIPRYRDKLVLNAQNWDGQRALKVTPQHDYRSNILINGASCFAADKRIESPGFLLHNPPPGFPRKINAKVAYFRRAANGRPCGYLLQEVVSKKSFSIDDTPSVFLEDGSPKILTSKDTKWLKPGECFVASEIGFEQISNGSLWRRYCSLRELIAGLHNPSLDYGADVRIAVHSRIIRPLMDMTLLLLGLPLALSRKNRNMFVAAGSALGLVVAFYLVQLLFQGLGASGMVSPELAAWSPLLIFAPIAFAMAAVLQE